MTVVSAAPEVGLSVALDAAAVVAGGDSAGSAVLVLVCVIVTSRDGVAGGESLCGCGKQKANTGGSLLQIAVDVGTHASTHKPVRARPPTRSRAW
jgi:hypothetical protein